MFVLEIIVEKKLNIKKFIAATLICIILMLVAINCVYDNFISNKNKEATIGYVQEVEAKKQEELKQKKELEEKKIKKYDALNNDEIAKIENIYEHSEPKRVFLTFDDGPTEAVTPFILDLLKKENIKGTFFVLGSMVENYPDLVKREYEEGHFIANHGYSHRYKEIYQSSDSVLDEYNRTNDLIKNAIGIPYYNSLVFRFPGGSSGGYYHDLKQEAKNKLKEQGIASLDWNALTRDSEGATTKEAIIENFSETVQDKTSVVLLMHDASDKILTYEALPDIITYFRNNGYVFKTVFDLFDRE